MISEFVIRQFALIEHARLELTPGMTVFSGETGAGKSILVDALGAAFGARARSEWVRFGAERAEVSVILSGADARIREQLASQDIDAGDDELILRRVIHADGRSRAYINSVPVAVKVLQQIGDICFDLHGQHEHQALLREEVQRQLLDARIEPALVTETRQAFAAWQEAEASLERLLNEREESGRQKSWMREELERLQGLELEERLEERLADEVAAGRHFAQIQEAAATALSALEGGEPNVRQLLARSSHALEPVADYRAGMRESLQLLEQMDALLGELEPALRPMLEEAFDAQALEAAESRLMVLHESMRRYQTNVSGLIAERDSLAERVARMDTAGWDEASCRKRLAETEDAYLKAADALSAARRKAADDLIEVLRPLLDTLALEGMRVRVDIDAHRDRSTQWSRHGFDTITFMAASNPGEPFRPLAAVASGGELSRFVLALKGCGAMSRMPQVAVFDEVDVGIGGETAWRIGELLAAMGTERQVLVVSHLPQVAACASGQIRIGKRQEGDRTVSTLKFLEEDERVAELARMLGGSDHAESLDHAGQMLQRGQQALEVAG